MGQINPTLPVAGSTLNSIADPELVTALLALITLVDGNIDPTNVNPTSGILHLAYRRLTVSGGVNAGDFVSAAAGVWTTLPAASVNAIVAVQADAATVPTNPCLVLAPGGANIIFGKGANGVSSIALGTPNAAVVLLCTGTNWAIIAGEQDTGWAALTLAPGVGFAGITTPAARLQGDATRLKGILLNTGGTIAANATWATIPAALRRTADPVNFVAAVGTTSQVVATVNTSGVITMGAPLGNGSQVTLDGPSYSLS